MTAKIIHVDFRTRQVVPTKKTLTRREIEAGFTLEELQEVLDAISMPSPAAEGPLPDDFLAPKAYIAGSKYEETCDLPLVDIAKVVRAYVKQTYPRMKFSVRTVGNTLWVFVTSPGPVAVFVNGHRSEAMREVLMDIGAFTSMFNRNVQVYDNQDLHYHGERFILHVAVSGKVEAAAWRKTQG